MGLFSTIDISSSGLTAQRLRMDIISNNIANVNTTRSKNGEPYRRQIPVFQERGSGIRFKDIFLQKEADNQIQKGVRVVGIKEDQSPFKLVYNPDHPDANEDGYVKMPNVDIIREMVDLISASRAYEANVTAINSSKNIFLKALEIARP
ncbi:MAG: flagellar basal-body rod protein FlgC [Thermosediminibacterales bacterium]|nr:flagellar basal-body rod protein FlgC [Thermosediminibacterales bacterium]